MGKEWIVAVTMPVDLSLRERSDQGLRSTGGRALEGQKKEDSIFVLDFKRPNQSQKEGIFHG